MKKIFYYAIVLLLTMSVTSNAQSFDYKGITYEVLSKNNKTACVARQVATDQIKGDVQIPCEVSYEGKKYTVTEIAGWAFSGCRQMTSIDIPATIQTIGYSAFYWCYGLEAVYLEDLAAWCGVSFGGGTERNPVSLAHHLYVNGEEVKDLVIPEGVTSIGDDAFHDATALTSVVIPSTVTRIGNAAFAGCNSISQLSIASGVKVIGSNAFGGCYGLKEVTIPEGTERLEAGAFYYCGQLTTVNLPQSLLSIGDYAFEQCSSLTAIEIPSQVAELGGRAFYECDELTSVRLSDNIPEIGDWTFTRCYKLKSINIPKNLKRLGDYSLFWCSSIEELTLPSTLTDISSSALIGCQGIRTLTVEEGNPKYLSENGVLFDHDKTTLMLFPAQSDVTHYDIPTTVTTILPGAFSGSQLKSITLSPLITEIGSSAFANLAKLESISIPSSISKIGSSAFSGCRSLKEFDVPDNVKSIDRSAFSDCSSLVRVHLPEGLTRIEGWLFDGCTSLNELNIPNGLNYIGTAAFRSCNSLSDFHIPEEVTIIDDEAFKGCQTLRVLSIPDKVENVGWDAYMGCSGLEKVTIGRSVKALEGGTFNGCDNIKEIRSYIEEPFDVIDYDVKDNDIYQIGRCFPEVVTHEAMLYVPQGTKEKYLAMKGWRDFTNIMTQQDMAYRPFVEDCKVWQVGAIGSGNPVQWVEHYYFDGETIIDGKSCKQMMCQRYVSPDHPDYNVISRLPSLSYVGAWYEEDKKVYFCNATSNQFKLMYDFSLDANDTLLIDNSSPYVVGPRQTGGIKGFKGVYRDVMMVWDEEQSIYNTTWLEGVGGIDGPIVSVYHGDEGHALFLMSCIVGDEVIYLNDDYEDGATPEVMNARKRIDFTHTIKVRPKAPSKRETSDKKGETVEESLYGEYNDVQLGLNLNPLDDAYLVRIADETGKTVYEKAVNAGSIVGLNVDISAYPKGRYTVTVENNSESFIGEFEAQTTGIVENLRIEKIKNESIYDLQGRRLTGRPTKGVYVVNGRKLYVK